MRQPRAPLPHISRDGGLWRCCSMRGWCAAYGETPEDAFNAWRLVSSVYP